jgi:hypothetical protein
MKAFGLLNQAFTSEANLNVWEQAEPNVDLNLHYARYEEGVRIPGVELLNSSESVLGVYRVEIAEFKVAPDGTGSLWRVYQQSFEDSYVGPNATSDLFFNSIEGPFPSDSRLHIQLRISTVEYERKFRWPAWELDPASGQAVPAEPLFYDTN